MATTEAKLLGNKPVLKLDTMAAAAAEGTIMDLIVCVVEEEEVNSSVRKCG